MVRKLSVLSGIILGCFIPTVATASITVTVERPGMGNETQFPTSGAAFSVDVSGTTTINITSTEAATDNVGRLTLSGTSGTGTRVNIQFLGGTLPLPCNANVPFACNDWAGVDVGANQGVRVTGRIRRNLTGTVDAYIVSMTIGGTVLAQVTARSPVDELRIKAGQIGSESSINGAFGVRGFGPAFTTIQTERRSAAACGEDAATGDINWKIDRGAGRINEITCTGALRADVTSTLGEIGTIIVAADRPIHRAIDETGTAMVSILSQSGIDLVSAGRGRVLIDAKNNGGSGSLKKLTIVGGDLAGQITTGSIPIPTVISEKIAWSIAGSLSATVTVGSGGIPGQTVVNASGSAGTWTAATTINGTSLIGVPEYTLASMPLGSGAIGAAPFRLYGNDSVPANEDPSGILRVCATQFAAMPVQLRMYGPVKVGSGGSIQNAVTIERDSGGGTWTSATSEFVVTLTGVGSRSVNRELRISDASGGGIPIGQFRVRPVLTGTSALLCDGLTSTSNVPVTDFTYYFKIVAICGNCTAADFDGSGTTDPDDLADYINAYFTVPPPSSADFDGSGTVDPDDLADYITTFFTPC